MNFDNNELLDRHEVRLFPVVRISSEREAELRAAASLLSMVRAVSEFGRRIVRLAGGPAGRISCFTEYPFHQEDGSLKSKELRPDGLIRCVRGKTEWTAMLEVKVGTSPLEQAQIDAYHHLASAEGFGALITISNQPAQANGQPPVAIDGRRARKVPVHHLSWERLLSEAQVLMRNTAVSDSDQAWMLQEWIRYIEDERSKVIVQPDLGSHWHEVLRAARGGNLATVARQLDDVVRNWDGFVRKTALRLRAKLGVEVEQRIRRGEQADPEKRLAQLHAAALESTTLSGEFKVPGAVGDISVEMLLPARSVRYGVDVDAPRDGRQLTRLKWLARQLSDSDWTPETMSVTTTWSQSRSLCCARLGDVLGDPAILLRDTNGQTIDKKLTPRKFRIEWTTRLQKGRSRGSTQVLEGISSDLERFYKRVVERLVPYTPKAPKLVSRPERGTEEPREDKAREQEERSLMVVEEAPDTREESSARDHELGGDEKDGFSGSS